MSSSFPSKPVTGTLSLFAESLVETIWPTRCVLCDAPGSVLCPSCSHLLSYIDPARACQRCGAPESRIQCTECNDIMLRSLGFQRLPYEQAASCVVFEPCAQRIITTFKDQGEQRLAPVIANVMNRYLSPMWVSAPLDAITFVPATRKAVNRRGFDHCHLLAAHLAKQARLPLLRTLKPPSHKDQRGLSRTQRALNLKQSGMTCDKDLTGKALVLIDDVCTTGATLLAASEALRMAHAVRIFCLTFARV